MNQENFEKIPASKNIYQKLDAVRKAVAYLQKDATVTGYKAITHDFVTSAVRPEMIKHGIVTIPKQKSYELRDTGKTTSKGVPFIAYVGMYEFDFVNIEDPQDKVTVTVGAMSEDTADKGPGGAISYAMKYALLKVFNIETGESEESRHDQKPEYINDDQATQIANLITESNSDRIKFLKYIGATSIEKITQKNYQKAVDALEAKKNADT